MKDFVEQLNDIIAPATRAWDFPEIQKVVVDPSYFPGEGDDEITVTVTLKLRRKKTLNPDLSNARQVVDSWIKNIKTNATAGEGTKRGVK